MPTFIVGFLLCVYFNVAVGNTELDPIQRLEKMVNDLKESSKIQDQKISAIQNENDKLTKRVSEISRENIQMKKDIRNLWKQNKRQMQINSELTLKIDEMHNQIRPRSQKKVGNNVNLSDTLNKFGNNFAKPSVHAEVWEDRHTTNSTTWRRYQPNGGESTGYRFQGRRIQRLLLPENQPSSPSSTAFFAYMSKTETNPGQHHTLIYDVAHTNVGGNYSPHTGAFTVPVHGVYVFTWNVYSGGSAGAYAYTEIVVNSNAVCGSFTSPHTNANAVTSPATVVLEVNQCDEVHIRTASDHAIVGNIYSASGYRSTFSGWKLF